MTRMQFRNPDEKDSWQKVESSLDNAAVFQLSISLWCPKNMSMHAVSFSDRISPWVEPNSENN